MLRHIRKKEKVFNLLTCCYCYWKFLVGMLPNLLQRQLYSQSAEIKVFFGQLYICLPREYRYMWEILPPCQSLPPKPALFPGAVFVLQKCYLSSAKLFLTRLCFRALERRWKQHLCRALGIWDSSCNKTLLSWILHPLQTHEQKWRDWVKVCRVHYLNSRPGERRKNKSKPAKSETLDWKFFHIKGKCLHWATDQDTEAKFKHFLTYSVFQALIFTF